ncbi:RNA-directed DNA polymerase from mobile element jockey [Eumeta japonica]|uniref:RNA-directed DNA polymerase from mobile element jockey n=1 Tax=Eumeta variegata TaxID=151549 RepID=A0A4C1V2T1_EUMVA|nr:RNA-directed DNA polymerase from mobile element jockey [Eumeta japonica]
MEITLIVDHMPTPPLENSQPSQQSNSKLEDMLLKQKSHTTSRSRINVPGYSVYLTPHPDGGAHAGAAIIIKNSVKHCLLDPFAAPLSPSYLH